MVKRIRLKKICVVCGECKNHHAKGMCSNCYHKERNKKPLNKDCSQYLGCTIAEKVLSKVFKDVEVMKPNNPGYDFICNKGKKIDVKSSCIRKQGNWMFHINRNLKADFFLCIAFDNRESLTPLHLWLIPLNEVKDKKGTKISPTTLHKWKAFELDISETLQCCDQMREP